MNSTTDTSTLTYPPAGEDRMCLKVFMNAVASYSYFFIGLSLACLMGHVLVLVVCWRERKKATYKQDIVYMVGLALVDIAVCFLVSVASRIPRVLNSEVFKSVFLLLVILSLNLLTTRAIERFKMVIIHKMRPWSFKVQLKVSLMVNATTVSLFSIIYYLDDFPIVALYMGVCSLIIVTSYTIIFGKLAKKYTKMTSQVVPSNVNDPKNKLTQSHKSQRETKLGETAGVDAPHASSSMPTDHTHITRVVISQASTSAVPTDLTAITRINNPQASTSSMPTDFINEQFLCVPKEKVGYESRAVTKPSNVTGTARNESSQLNHTKQKTTVIGENKPENKKAQKNTCSETAIRDGQNPSSNMQTRKKKVVFHVGLGLLLVTVVFYISWIPVLLAKFTDWVPCEVMIVAGLNFTTNPLIYFVTLTNFREAVVVLIVPKCCRSYANR